MNGRPRVRRSLVTSLVLGVIAGIVGPTSAEACSVPVYRYALEHWSPDPYVAIVFHRGELSDEQQALLEQLNPRNESGFPVANIIVRTVDLDDDPSETIVALWEQHDTQTLPLLSLQTPPRLGPPQTAWQGELSAGNVAALIDSPARRKLRDRLLAGDSVVWLLLESGDESRDEKAFQVLDEELTRLQEAIELPDIEEQDLSELSVDPSSLRVRFSAIRISRENDRERVLVETLLHVEGDLRDEPYVSQPMAFPVFGRGRALYALVGDGITPETIEDASRFLTGACQCTVKAQNPGVDLLMAVDWENHVEPALPYDQSTPSLAGLGTFASPDEVPNELQDEESGGSSRSVPRAESTRGPKAEESIPSMDSATKPGVPPVATQVGAGPADGGVRSLATNISVLLGVIVAGVVFVTILVLIKSR